MMGPGQAAIRPEITERSQYIKVSCASFTEIAFGPPCGWTRIMALT
jgi:hypothetical protein